MVLQVKMLFFLFFFLETATLTAEIINFIKYTLLTLGGTSFWLLFGRDLKKCQCSPVILVHNNK